MSLLYCIKIQKKYIKIQIRKTASRLMKKAIGNMLPGIVGNRSKESNMSGVVVQKTEEGGSTLVKARDGAAAAKAFLSIRSSVKESALALISRRLVERSQEIFKANAEDVERAKEAGLSPAILKRLVYDEAKLRDSLTMIEAIRRMPEPSGRILEARRLDEGLVLRRVSCPIGLIALIFESRPDALVQMAALAAKSGNAIIVKGGREAERTNRILAEIICRSGEEAGLPEAWLGAVQTREAVSELLSLDDYVDLVIPRGSKEFVRHIQETSRIPVLGHSDGVCHVYVHDDADLDMAMRITVDSKAQYPAACNAAEVLLVHKDAAPRVLPAIAAGLERASVRLDLCPASYSILGPAKGRTEKKDDAWSVEYLDLRMAVRVVDSLDAAIAHINRYGSGHTDSIVTASREAAERFMNGVDSSSVYWNASTRFADGYRYGLGAEVGISTGKLHARGPMGLEGLMTYKWKLIGQGQIVADYVGGARSFEHAELKGERDTYYEGR